MREEEHLDSVFRGGNKFVVYKWRYRLKCPIYVHHYPSDVKAFFSFIQHIHKSILRQSRLISPLLSGIYTLSSRKKKNMFK